MTCQDGRTDGQALMIRISQDALDGGWIGECPSLPGCFSQGETISAVLCNLGDAITAVISTSSEVAKEEDHDDRLDTP